MQPTDVLEQDEQTAHVPLLFRNKLHIEYVESFLYSQAISNQYPHRS